MGQTTLAFQTKSEKYQKTSNFVDTS